MKLHFAMSESYEWGVVPSETYQKLKVGEEVSGFFNNVACLKKGDDGIVSVDTTMEGVLLCDWEKLALVVREWATQEEDE